MLLRHPWYKIRDSPRNSQLPGPQASSRNPIKSDRGTSFIARYGFHGRFPFLHLVRGLLCILYPSLRASSRYALRFAVEEGLAPLSFYGSRTEVFRISEVLQFTRKGSPGPPLVTPSGTRNLSSDFVRDVTRAITPARIGWLPELMVVATAPVGAGLRCTPRVRNLNYRRSHARGWPFVLAFNAR